MKAEVKKVNGRYVYKRSGRNWEKVKISVISFLLGVMLTLMFYPIIRP